MNPAAIPIDRSRPPAPRALEPFRFPPFEHRRISDGLELWTAVRREVPLVYLELLSPGGGLHDPPGRSGLAALTAGLMDEGAGGRDSTEIARAVERLGGYLHASADWDATSVSTSVLSRHLDAALGLAAEVATAPDFPLEEIERLRQRTLAEIERRRAQPSSVARVALHRAIFGDAAYGQPLVGTTESVEAATREEIVEFYERRIAVSGCHLIAVGDLDPERLAASAAAAFGGLARRPAEEAPVIEPLDRQRPRVVVVDRPGAAQTELRVGLPGIARDDPDYVAATVLNTLLGGKFMSRINLNLRERNGFTYGANSRFLARRRAGPFVISAAVGNEVAAAAAREIVGELRRIRERPVTPVELEDTRSYLLGVFPYTVQTLGGVAGRLDDLAVYGLPHDHYDRLPGRLASVTADQLLEVARRLIDPERLVIVAAGPGDPLADDLAALGEVRVESP